MLINKNLSLSSISLVSKSSFKNIKITYLIVKIPLNENALLIGTPPPDTTITLFLPKISGHFTCFLQQKNQFSISTNIRVLHLKTK